MLKIKNLIKKYGNLIAVNNLNLSINNGKIFGFIGPNGAGKTTTIKVIAGLLDFDEGIIEINNYNIKTQSNMTKKIIGYIPDTPFMYNKLTGREFLYFIGKIYKMENKSIEYEIEKYSEILEFKNYMDIKTEEYSHGMKQRIIIASAFLHNPKLVLIDEPMVGLDPKSANTVKNLFIEYAKNNKGTIFVSTHTLSLAEEICDEIGIMNKGKLIYSGGIDNLREKLKKKNLEELFLEITK